MKTVIALLLASTAVFAGEKTTIECSKHGRNGGQPAFAKVDLIFDVSVDGRNDLRVISDLRGEIRAAGSRLDLASEDAYVGVFEVKHVAENPEYRPIKYKNSSQFKGIDAKETRGAESGMWGHLIVPRDTRGEFESHYVFQAGDHMGGTIHMSCREKN